MPLVTAKEIMERADRDGYAIGAFNVDSLESVEAVVDAAEAERSPVIIAVGQGALAQARLPVIADMVKSIARNTHVPAALHLDHGTSFEQAVQCIREGFTSIMIDGSRLPFEENVRLVARVVAVADAVGVPVEGELGQIGGTEDLLEVSDDMAGLTDPETVAPFVTQTGVTSLAVSIGTAHGLYKREPKLRFDLLEQINRLTPAMLVLHGGSGVPDEAIRRAISLGINKINVATELRVAYTKAAIQVIQPEQGNQPKVMAAGRAAMREVVRQKMRLFGSSGKA